MHSYTVRQKLDAILCEPCSYYGSASIPKWPQKQARREGGGVRGGSLEPPLFFFFFFFFKRKQKYIISMYMIQQI